MFAMVHYVNTLSALSSVGLCRVPARESLCVSMAVMGLLCMAVALALLLKEGRSNPV